MFFADFKVVLLLIICHQLHFLKNDKKDVFLILSFCPSSLLFSHLSDSTAKSRCSSSYFIAAPLKRAELFSLLRPGCVSALLAQCYLSDSQLHCHSESEIVTFINTTGTLIVIIQLNNNLIVKGLVHFFSLSHINSKTSSIWWYSMIQFKAVRQSCMVVIMWYMWLFIFAECHLNVRHVRLSVPLCSPVLLASIKQMLI